MDAFVERQFELDGQPLIARFFLPQRAATGEFQCAWTLDWPDRRQSDRACGEDSVQALMLAMKSAHIELAQTQAYAEGRITLWTQKDLDLPPTWGAGPLYFVPPRKS